MSSTQVVPEEMTLAAYCRESNTLFYYEERDLFSGELFCPHCTCRTEAEDRARTMRDLKSRFPEGELYEKPLPTAKSRPHARS